jgi:hypothetical protein
MIWMKQKLCSFSFLDSKAHEIIQKERPLHREGYNIKPDIEETGHES